MSTTSQIITSQQASQPIKVEIENPISTQPTGFNWLTLISIRTYAKEKFDWGNANELRSEYGK